jgi:hypothetical protein
MLGLPDTLPDTIMNDTILEKIHELCKNNNFKGCIVIFQKSEDENQHLIVSHNLTLEETREGLHVGVFYNELNQI